jgi:hypothetical protein
MSFDYFMRSGHFAKVGGEGGFDLYTDNNGDVLVDDVYLYEDLDQAISVIEQKLGINLPALPNAKGNFREDKRPYAALYSDTYKNLIAEAFNREIIQFGYRF